MEPKLEITMKRRNFITASIGSTLALLLWPWKGKAEPEFGTISERLHFCEGCGIPAREAKVFTAWTDIKVIGWTKPDEGGVSWPLREGDGNVHMHCEKCLPDHMKQDEPDIHEAQIKAWQKGTVSKEEHRAHLRLP